MFDTLFILNKALVSCYKLLLFQVIAYIRSNLTKLLIRSKLHYLPEHSGGAVKDRVPSGWQTVETLSSVSYPYKQE